MPLVRMGFDAKLDFAPLPSSWDFFALGRRVSPHSRSSTGPRSHHSSFKRPMGLQTWGPQKVGDDGATELPLLRAAHPGFTCELFHTHFVSPICPLLHFRHILSLITKMGSPYINFLASYSYSVVMPNSPFQTTPRKREWVDRKAQWPCRGKLICSFSLMSLAADVELFEMILISKFGFKVSTTHSAFFWGLSSLFHLYMEKPVNLVLTTLSPKCLSPGVWASPCLLAESPFSVPGLLHDAGHWQTSFIITTLKEEV